MMNLAIFYFVAIHESDKELEISDMNGLGNTYPVMGAGIVLVVLALIGLPPTAGFSIKLVLFSLVWEAYQASSGPLLLAYFVVGILSSAISLYFYLKVPFHYFLKKPSEEAISVSLQGRVVTTFLALLLLWFFIQPGILNNIAVTIGTP